MTAFRGKKIDGMVYTFGRQCLVNVSTIRLPHAPLKRCQLEAHLRVDAAQDPSAAPLARLPDSL